MKEKKNGFTLVELLAVIVILAIVLVIAVPKVLDVIKDSKKATLESTAKMIASSAEKLKVQNDLLGKTEDFDCYKVAKINNIDYANCDIDFDGNTAKVTIQGSGKFEGLYVCGGTKTNSIATDESCTLVSLTVDTDGGTETTYNPKYEAGSTVTLAETTKEGYTFVSWVVETGEGAVINENTLTMGTTATKVKATWEEYSDDYPTLLDGPTIKYLMLEEAGIIDLIVEFEFVDTYVAIGEDEPFDLSNNQDGSILAYVVPTSESFSEYKLVVVGNGSGGILLNEDSSHMFEWFTNLKEIKGMDLLRWGNVKNNDYMFAYSGIETIDLSNATIIGEGTFSGCENLTSITIPGSVTSIGDAAFIMCSSLTSVTIPNSVTSIGSNTFKDCTSLASIVIPNSVTSIGQSAFYSCASLTSITIPDSITSISDYAFAYSSLTSITIPNSVTSIRGGAFYNSNNLTDVYYTGKEEEWNSITIGSYNTPLTNATKHYESVVE